MIIAGYLYPANTLVILQVPPMDISLSEASSQICLEALARPANNSLDIARNVHKEASLASLVGRLSRQDFFSHRRLGGLACTNHAPFPPFLPQAPLTQPSCHCTNPCPA